MGVTTPPERSHRNNSPVRGNSSHEPALFALVLFAAIAIALYAAVAVPTLVWSTVQGEPTLVSFGDAVGGAIRSS
jgi:hypothetical protein